MEEEYIMKLFLTFCCNLSCAENTFNDLINKHRQELVKRNLKNFELFINNDLYKIIIDPNNNRNKFFGLIINNYSVCIHYTLSKESYFYLQSHLFYKNNTEEEYL
jgi:hypothetical protein